MDKLENSTQLLSSSVRLFLTELGFEQSAHFDGAQLCVCGCSTVFCLFFSFSFSLYRFFGIRTFFAANRRASHARGRVRALFSVGRKRWRTPEHC